MNWSSLIFSIVMWAIVGIVIYIIWKVQYDTDKDDSLRERISSVIKSEELGIAFKIAGVVAVGLFIFSIIGWITTTKAYKAFEDALTVIICILGGVSLLVGIFLKAKSYMQDK